ncbi:hypothetical protein [Intestinibacter bartlettii]|uniref:hypothetical protein n=1 Tax=Intestinibacter bartlettii TaxID=261299 RepID=UPI0012E9674E|nr:hypothetical protein [Intestinibacter bartlettii]MCB5744961.1 hypothetical protein [Intestinibacter bartlettii]MDU1252917.1 hypothetical protein [Peptostreptococcaceae bacterium]MDU2695051.1 hypothetical protein [Intestinibacter bartlettii]MDU6198133.1 hypothetical protein [Intestinibacter bartlettii]
MSGNVFRYIVGAFESSGGAFEDFMGVFESSVVTLGDLLSLGVLILVSLVGAFGFSGMLS